MPNDEVPALTSGRDYAERLQRLSGKRWKTVLDVQRPFHWNLRRMNLGRTVEVGCGIGRLLQSLPAGSVGIDHNADAVRMARDRGMVAYTSAEWDCHEMSRSGLFDSMLLAHVVEHMTAEDAVNLLRHYLPAVCPGGKVAFIVPQEAGYRSDPTHVRFLDVQELTDLAANVGLLPIRSWSFPFPRPVGRIFAYNETCLLARHVPTNAPHASA
ncbi:MAG TPA: class I SAM-dependent methyltransferase [Chloroflexota bacterium]